MGNLTDKYAVVGVGETGYSRGSGMTTRALATTAVKRAMDDAGLKADGVDGLMSYSGGDSTDSLCVASDLGIRPNFYMDVFGGGSSTEALIGLAIGAIEGGMCHTVAIYRAMNGYSQIRIGGTGARSAVPAAKNAQWEMPYGLNSPGQRFAFSFMRHMHDFGTTSEQVAHVRVAHSYGASCNPKALRKGRLTVEDVVGSRWIVKPLHLLDCCLETDNGTALIVTSAERARDLKHRPALIMSAVGRTTKPHPDWHFTHGPISTVQGIYIAPRVFELAGISHDDVDITGSYDAFTFTTMLQLEDYGYCKKGEGGDYVSDGTIFLGGSRPNNPHGGHLCEGYTHGISHVVEMVRQLRGTVDDYCPNAAQGEHTYDYSEFGCRQIKDANITHNMGWGTPALGSSLIMRRG
jgi:acetyl-CoA acetyltransferase